MKLDNMKMQILFLGSKLFNLIKSSRAILIIAFVKFKADSIIQLKMMINNLSQIILQT